MDNVFTKKIGPFPGWIWVGAGVGVLLLAGYARKSKTTTTPGPDANTIAGESVITTTGNAGASYNGAAQGSNDALTTWLNAVSGNALASTPGNEGTEVVTPGNTGSAAIQNIRAGNYAQQVGGNSSVVELGTIIEQGGLYSGYNVGGGAPVYADINGQWMQNFDAKTLAAGTRLATLPGFAGNVGTTKVTEQL